MKEKQQKESEAIYAEIWIETSLGSARFSVNAVGQIGKDHVARLHALDVDPRLPEGYKVDRVRAILLIAESESGFQHISFSCELDTQADIDYCGGEGLAARCWDDRSSLVGIGTEDGEWLDGRIPKAYMTPEARDATRIEIEDFVELTDKGMRVSFFGIPNDFQLTLHFVLAENRYPEELEASVWYAIDVPHKRILDTFKRFTT